MERRKRIFVGAGAGAAVLCLATVGLLLPKDPLRVPAPATGHLQADLEGLAERSLAAEDACRRFFEGVPEGRTKLDRAAAVALLDKMAGYPGIPDSTREAWRRLASEEAAADLSHPVGLPHCRFDKAAVTYRNLVESSGVLREGERRRLARAVVDFVDTASRGPLSLDNLLHTVGLLRESRRYRLVSLERTQSGLLDRLFGYASLLNARLDERWTDLQGKDDRERLAAHLKYRYAQAERIRGDFLPIVLAARASLRGA